MAGKSTTKESTSNASGMFVDRWQLFLALLQMGLLAVIAKNLMLWPEALNAYADCMDEHIQFMVVDGTNPDSERSDTVQAKVTEYINWKLGVHGKPYWFVKSGE